MAIYLRFPTQSHFAVVVTKRQKKMNTHTTTTHVQWNLSSRFILLLKKMTSEEAKKRTPRKPIKILPKEMCNLFICKPFWTLSVVSITQIRGKTYWKLRAHTHAHLRAESCDRNVFFSLCDAAANKIIPQAMYGFVLHLC